MGSKLLLYFTFNVLSVTADISYTRFFKSAITSADGPVIPNL